MNIVQMLALVGHRNIQYQVLHQNITHAERKTRKLRNPVTMITFGTMEDIGSLGLIGKPTRVGLVVWVDAERLDIAQATPMPVYSVQVHKCEHVVAKDGVPMSIEDVVAALNEG